MGAATLSVRKHSRKKTPACTHVLRWRVVQVAVCVDAVEQVQQLSEASTRSQFPGGVGAMIELNVGE